MRRTVRAPIYLVNPTVFSTFDYSLPKFAVVHYLDINSGSHFPSLDLRYYKNSDKTKKFPICHVMDLDSKEEITTLLNKQPMAEVRKWTKSNLKHFKELDLFHSVNNSANVVGTINYNMLKDMYKYRSAPLSKHYSYYNLYKTYWNSVKKALDTTKIDEIKHVVSIDIPTLIPNYFIIDRLIAFNEIKYSRMVTDINLKNIIELYKWLNNDTRSKSVMSDISDEDASKILVEFKYKEYVTILPLHVIRSASEQSDIKSTIKLPHDKLSKLYLMFLRKIQFIVDNSDEEAIAKIDDEVTNDVYINTNTIDDVVKPVVKIEEEENDEVDVETSQSFNYELPTEKIVTITEVIKKESKTKQEISKLEDDVFDEDFGVDDLDKSIEEEAYNISETDRLFIDAISKASEEDEAAEVVEEKPSLAVDYSEEKKSEIVRDVSLNEKIDHHIKVAKEMKLLTAAEIRSINKAKEAREVLPSPYNTKLTLTTQATIDPEDKRLDIDSYKLPESTPVISEFNKVNKLKSFDRTYLDKGMKKDILAMVTNIEKSGVIVTNYTIDDVKSSVDNYELHRLSLKPLVGKESTVTFRIPKISEEGIIKAGNVKMRLRKVRTELPIRKISPSRVALTSSYGKLFVFTSPMKAYDLYGFYINYVKEEYLSDGVVSSLELNIKKINNLKLPNVYQAFASEFNSFTIDKNTFVFDYGNDTKYVSEAVAKDIESKKLFFCGYVNNKDILVMDMDSKIYNYSDKMSAMDDIEVLMKIDPEKLPKPFSCVKLIGKDIPLGVTLSYMVGLSNLVSATNTQYEILERNKRYSYTKGELMLQFDDCKLVLKTDTLSKQLLFNGFRHYKNVLKTINLKSLDNQDVYLNIIEERNANVIHLKEMDVVRDLFLDPITVDVLKEMKEPTEFIPLLLRANSLLTTLDHPDLNDTRYNRIRGHDRIPSLMYMAITESVREQKFKGRANSKIEMDPYKVWNFIMKDSTLKIMEEVNPVVDLKEREVVTFNGREGLDSRSTPVTMRNYHRNDMGVISEATVDSADVALNTYLVANPNLANTRGMVDVDALDVKSNPASLLSTSANLAPFSETDDPKRVNFINIQNGHTISADNYRQPAVRTGEEYGMMYRVSSLFANPAIDDGVVTEVSEKRIVVKYKSGEVATYPIGLRIGRMEGSAYPHELVTDLVKGSKFKKDDCISYNKGFFERDWLNPSKVIFKTNGPITTALTANDETFEDSTALSKRVSKLVTTKVFKEKIFLIESTKHIVNLLPVGTNVSPGDTLFTILDTDTNYDNLSEDTIALLKNLSALSPTSKYKGTISRYEIKYNGSKGDMSPSFRKLANQLDKELIEETKGTFDEAEDNSVTMEYRSEGKNINIDMLELKVFISIELEQQIGDKGVFGNQMKSVVGDVYDKSITTESGDVVDAMFAYDGILRRVANSPIVQGVATRLLRKVGNKVADIYFGK